MNLPQITVVDVKDEAAYFGVINEVTGLQGRHGLSHVEVDVVVGAQAKRWTFTKRRSEFILQFVFVKVLETAARVVDHHY